MRDKPLALSGPLVLLHTCQPMQSLVERCRPAFTECLFESTHPLNRQPASPKMPNQEIESFIVGENHTTPLREGSQVLPQVECDVKVECILAPPFDVDV